MHSPVKDYHMPKCRWPLESSTYDGLCSHFSISESYEYERPDPGLSRDDINRFELQRQQEYAEARLEDWAQNTKRHGDTAIQEQRYECKPCGLTVRSNAKKLLHESRDVHKRKVAGTVTVPKGRTTENFWRHDCEWKASCSERLRIHLAGPRHAKKLRDKAIKAGLGGPV